MTTSQPTERNALIIELLDSSTWASVLRSKLGVELDKFADALVAATSRNDFAERIGAISRVPNAGSRVSNTLAERPFARMELDQARKWLSLQPFG